YPAPDFAQGHELVVGQARLIGDRRFVGHFLDPAAGCGDLPRVLVRDVAHTDLAGDLAHHPAVGRHFARNHRTAQAPGAFHGDDRLVARQWTAGEHHPGAHRIDHPLDHHRHRHAVFRQALLAAIGHALHRIEAAPALAYAG